MSRRAPAPWFRPGRGRAARAIFVAVAAALPTLTIVGCLLRQDLGNDRHGTEPTEEPPGARFPERDAGSARPAPEPSAKPDAGEGDSGDSGDGDSAGASEGGALSPAAAEAFDPLSCPGKPIGFAGLASIVKTPVPYRIYGRVRDCVGDDCTEWSALPEAAVVNEGLGGLFRPAGRTGTMVAGPFNTFRLISDESCAGATDPYGSDQCEIQDAVKAVCGYYVAPTLGDAGSCSPALAVPYFVGSSSPSCVQLASGYLDQMTGRHYQFAVLIRF